MLRAAGSVMTITNLVSFTRRWNRDSSIDSICTKCYRTIASANKEDELAIREKNHVCDPCEQAIRPDADSHQPTCGVTHQANVHAN